MITRNSVNGLDSAKLTKKEMPERLLDAVVLLSRYMLFNIDQSLFVYSDGFWQLLSFVVVAAIVTFAIVFFAVCFCCCYSCKVLLLLLLFLFLLLYFLLCVFFLLLQL